MGIKCRMTGMEVNYPCSRVCELFDDCVKAFEAQAKSMENILTLTCPHCGREQFAHEPDSISAHSCLTICESCDKEFWYSVTVTRTYSSWVEN